jgi:glutathione S-transferase
MLLLYEIALSPFAQKVKMAMLEKQLHYETRVPILGAGEADFRAANPRQEVPALVDDGFAVFDSSIILEYLEDKWPTPALRPDTPAERARVRMIEEVCDTQFEAINWAMSEILVMRRAEGTLAECLVARAAQELAGLRRWLARQLGDRHWFNGDRFGYGDISVFPFLMSATFHKHGPEESSSLAHWLARVRERPSAKRVLADAKAALTTVAPVIRNNALSGARPRQYRDHRLEFMLRAGGIAVVERGLANGTIRFSSLPA